MVTVAAPAPPADDGGNSRSVIALIWRGGDAAVKTLQVVIPTPPLAAVLGAVAALVLLAVAWGDRSHGSTVASWGASSCSVRRASPGSGSA